MPKCLTRKEWFDLLENLSDTHVRIDFIGFEIGSQTIYGGGVSFELSMSVDESFAKIEILMAKQNKNALIIFARDPIVGQVKTRLNPFLDLQTTCELYTCFLSDSLDTISAVESVDCFVGIYPSSVSGYFERLDTSLSISTFVQEGKDLGERMKSTFSARFAEGYEQVVIIGADSPSLPLAYIRQALGSKQDVVLGPSVDGGYYLIGMRGKLINLFDGITWGGDTVLEETRCKLESNGVSLELLPVWYDVDRSDDLIFLKTHLELMAAVGHKEGVLTQKFLSTLSF